MHKCDPEPLTNTLPGRDGYDIEIFGMEGVPANAQAEWKARKEAEAGTALLAAAAAAKRPRNSYNVIPEADLRAALAQHKMLMATRNKAAPATLFPPFIGGHPPFPPGFPPAGAPPFAGMPPALPPGAIPPFAPPGVRPPFAPPGPSPIPSAGNPPDNVAAPTFTSAPPPNFVPSGGSSVLAEVTNVLPSKDGFIWPDNAASPYEKRAQQPRYRYTSPAHGVEEDDGIGAGRKRKAAADFL